MKKDKFKDFESQVISSVHLKNICGGRKISNVTGTNNTGSDSSTVDVKWDEDDGTSSVECGMSDDDYWN